MIFLTRLAILFYVTVISILGVISMLFLARVIELEPVTQFLSYVYHDPNVGTIAGGIVAIIMLKSFMFARIIYGRQQKERTIAFNNPSGQVSISLSAMEDMIRRLIDKMPDIKEIRPHIVASKKGLNVEIRLVLKSDVNIPDLTADLQDRVMEKIQAVIGIEGKVNVRVHVLKIISETPKVKKSKDKNQEQDADKKDQPAVPFHGYRA